MSRRLLLALCFFPALSSAQSPTADTIRAGRFDLGRMWTFEAPPMEYFSSTYGFTADSAWFARARLAALRIPGCSAAFVSPNGLIITNHHCARSGVSAVARPGETLLDSGFVAQSLAEERRIPNFVADQLIAVEDVTVEMSAALQQTRRSSAAAIQARLKGQFAGAGDSIVVQVVALYNGARSSAYVFRRFTDVRLVAAPELQLGFFGGDSDNFTFPRYDLDFAVLRAYGPDGRPYRTEHWFRWGGGVKPGDAVFVIGNPGTTSRLTTVSQLEYQHEVAVPVTAGFLRSRLGAMQAYHEASPAESERYDIRNRMFSLSNSLKSVDGRLEALGDPGIMARRRDAERSLRDSITVRRDLRERYGGLYDRMAELQRQKARLAVPFRAFSQLLTTTAGSGTLQASYWVYRVRHGPADSTAFYRDRLGRAPRVPPDLERRFLALQLEDMARAYGPGHEVTQAALGGATPEASAQQLLSRTALGDSAGRQRAAAGELADDAMLRLADVFMPPMLAMQAEMARLGAEEADLAAGIGRARFDVYGPSIPPDGSSSPRIADGVVQGYGYNGTLAPPFTTFYGMYDRFRSHGTGTEWDLPYRWRSPPLGLDLGTPLNFVSTADTYGGNSGSPAVTRDLQLVGLNFDRNINALVRDYIYLPERGRNVMVDVRAIQAALEYVYHAGRVVAELRTGRLAEP